jgi:hypothetical protein
MYLSGKVIHTFWAPNRDAGQTLQRVINVGLCASQIAFAADTEHQRQRSDL